ncbi:MarR family transcriptional regulator [Priestia megaterium]|nr:MarR family transcriptional regulator [Priestia megaterium]
MSRLYERNGQKQNELATRNERDQASVSRLLVNMIKKNLVERVSHPTDYRVNVIYLTDYGEEIRSDLEELAKRTVAEASYGIAEEELQYCLDTLNKIRNNLK